MKIKPSQRKRNKKGVSPLIATILLIVIAISIFLIIFVWLRSLVSEQIMKFEKPIETVCDEVSFSAKADGNIITISNYGNVPIVGMNVKVKIGGSTKRKDLAKPKDGVISPGETDVIDMGEVAPNLGFSTASQKTIAPKIQGQGKSSLKPKLFICTSKAVDV
jgi:flagellin-like protein